MLRSTLAVGALAILLLATGCTMCCRPYDNCGPVYDGGCGSGSCGPHARAGSILGGGQGVVQSQEVVAAQVKARSPRPAMPAQAARPARNDARMQAARPVRMDPRTQARARVPTPARSPIQERSTAPSQASIQAAIRAETRGDEVAGSEKIVSITDRVIGPSLSAADSAEVAADATTDTSTDANGDATTDAVKPPSYQGWTARRPSAIR